jgi:hypothetical protein
MSERRDSHLTVYLAWPLLAGLGLAAVAGVSVGGIAGLRAGNLGAGLQAAAWAFFLTLGVATLLVFAYAAGEWAGPRYEALMSSRRTIERIETINEPEPPEEPAPRFIPIYNRRPLTLPAPEQPQPLALSPRQKIAGFLADRLAARGRETVYESTGGDVDDAAPDQAAESWPRWVVEMYGILEATYSTGALSRRDFERAFEGGKALWRHYINGDPSQSGHRGKSVFQLWGIISQTGPRGSWEYSQDWETIIHLDSDLLAYARTREGDHSPGGRRSGTNG